MLSEVRNKEWKSSDRSFVSEHRLKIMGERRKLYVCLLFGGGGLQWSSDVCSSDLPCSRFHRTVQEKEKLLTIIDTEQDLYKISPLPTAPIITAYTHPPQKKLMKRCMRSHHLYNTPCHQRTSLSRLYKALENGLKWVETCNCGIYVHFVHKLYWVLMANYTLYLFIEHNGDVTLKRL